MKERIKDLYLIELLRLGARGKFIRVPTTFLSRVFGVSQQTASRVINLLHKGGLVDKDIINGVTCVKITEKGLERLRKLKRELEEAFNSPGVIEFEGKVFTGFGEGAYYVKKRAYRKQFFKILGFEPYPGTLNVKLEKKELIEKNRELRQMRGIKVLGFEDRFRTYGDVYVYRALIEDTLEGAIVYAERTHYDERVIEIISPYYLRRRLGLKDGDLIRFKVFLSQSL